MRFSVVIPSLNHADFLPQALHSVLSQAGDDTEVLVMDGGSTDGSVAIIRQHARRLAGWVSEPDGGQAVALNKGFSRACGDYLLWLNADDLLLPGTLDAARQFFSRRPDCAWLAGNLIYLDDGGRVLYCARDGAWHDRLFVHAPVRVYGPTAFIARSMFQHVGGFDETLQYAMDTDLWLRLRAAGARFERLRHYCWAFRIHRGSKTSEALRGRPGPEIRAEVSRVYARNGLTVTAGGIWQQRLWRLANGCYLRAAYDTLRLRGRRLEAGDFAGDGRMRSRS